MALKTGCVSAIELLMDERISPVAPWNSSACFSSEVRSSTLRSRPGVRLAQLRGHPVELSGERLELVAGAHLDLAVEVAGADALRALLQGADRAHHAAREVHRRQRGEQQASDDQRYGAQDGGVERCVDLGRRLLDEHLPPEDARRPAARRLLARGLDRCVGRQHALPVQVLRQHRRRVVGAGRERRLHLLQPREVGLAQHQADIRVGHQVPGGVHDVRLALLADADARHHVPDELQVHLGYRHRAGLAARAHRDRHVGLGLLAEIHRAEPGLAGARVLEGGLLRAVLVGAGDVHRQARHRQLLAALRIDLRDVGDGRHHAQQLEELDAPLLQALGAELRQRGEGELLLDLADELLDARRRAGGLLALQAGERLLVLLVGEVQADAARDQQRAADQREDQQEILAEQPAAVLAHDSLRGDDGLDRLQSITFSACTSTDRGTVMPRLRATRRSIWNSYFVGCSIGRSPGLAPLKIRSTKTATRCGT